MNIDFRRLIYIIATTCIIFLVGVLFINLLPWLILAGVVLYIIFKIKSFIRYKKIEKQKNTMNTDTSNNYNVNTYTPSDEGYTGEIIDLYYEETDDK